MTIRIPARTPARALSVLLAGSLLVGTPAHPAGASQEGGSSRSSVQTSEDIDTARATLEKWVELRRIVSQEKRDRALGREVLVDRTRMVEAEIAKLRESITAAQASIAESDKKRAELLAERDRLVQASAGLVTTVGALEQRLRELLVRLPDPIRERVKPLSQLLPADEAAAQKVSLDQRFRNVLGIQNEVDKFAREITVVSEVRSLADGTAAEVTTVYLGISHGFYVNGAGTIAGIGHGSERGFEWKAAPDAAPAIAATIAILNNERVAEFVSLPIRID